MSGALRLGQNHPTRFASPHARGSQTHTALAIAHRRLGRFRRGTALDG